MRDRLVERAMRGEQELLTTVKLRPADVLHASSSPAG
jgi:hypothetical protein